MEKIKKKQREERDIKSIILYNKERDRKKIDYNAYKIDLFAYWFRNMMYGLFGLFGILVDEIDYDVCMLRYESMPICIDGIYTTIYDVFMNVYMHVNITKMKIK